MVMCTSWDVFQTKLEEHVSNIEVVEMYIINTLVHIRDGFTKYIYHLIVIFARFCGTGLEPIATKLSLGLNYIPYLGCVITWGGIKPDPFKVH